MLGSHRICLLQCNTDGFDQGLSIGERLRDNLDGSLEGFVDNQGKGFLDCNRGHQTIICSNVCRVSFREKNHYRQLAQQVSVELVESC